MTMPPIYVTAEIRQIEQGFIAANPDVSLMERAGLAAAEKARDMLRDGFRVLVVCGPGNNGGDGLVVARHLRVWGYQVTTVLLGDAAKLPADAAKAYQQFVAADETIVPQIPNGRHWDLIVDSLLGIGLGRAVEGAFANAIEQINASHTPVLSIDIPSGLDSDTGNVRGIAINATETITFIGLKPGLLTADGKDHVGRLTVASLDINVEEFVEPHGRLLDQTTVTRYLPRRRWNSHKGSFGSVGIMGGAEGMQGAAALAGRAALKLGAGRVYVGTLAKSASGYDPIQPELMWRDAEALLSLDHLTTLVAGPGMGQSHEARALLVRLLEMQMPLTLDADALNLIAADEPLQVALATREHETILTPHPAEAARLLGSDTAMVQGNRIAAALELAERFQTMVALKGAGTICATPAGNWFINPTGNPGMASAGTGDVLSGIVGALLAQGLKAEEALTLGVYLHGAAADALVDGGIGPVGLAASEIIEEARRLLNLWMNVEE
ncbi:MAG TPA: NAD(P)H-hydrate dehydratase [Burkholderiales bacterium]|nr:NAD(P)H-hydrate dehydratase [Burkholderiales bacterium]